jgi:hypothetical protein
MLNLTRMGWKPADHNAGKMPAVHNAGETGPRWKFQEFEKGARVIRSAFLSLVTKQGIII